MLKHKAKLLSDIANGLLRNSNSEIDDLEVAFYVGAKRFEIGAVYVALDYIANDIYWDERGNWSEADVASVYTL